MTNKGVLLIMILLLLALLVACTAMKSGYQVPPAHPEELGKGRPTCSECHEKSSENLNYERYNHTVFFMENHRLEAQQDEEVCTMCHQTSFCNDCHATRVELKPSERQKTDTYRRMPHRGNYLSRHRIDGRVDPTSCFRCHGNPKTAQTCAPCHPNDRRR